MGDAMSEQTAVAMTCDIAPQPLTGSAAMRLLRLILFVIGGLVTVAAIVTVTATMASAGPHRVDKSGATGKTGSGVILCSGRHHVVTYAKTRCPKHTKQLRLAGQTEMASLQKTVAGLKKTVTGLQRTVATLRADNVALSDRVGSLDGLLTGVSRGKDADGYETLTISGENVQINDGSGSENTTDGLGNLIVGYDQDNLDSYARSGSNNLIVGDDSGWTSFGALLAGFDNRVGAEYGAITGGEGNQVTGNEASVSAGEDNTAQSAQSGIAGGVDNRTSGSADAIAGGYGNVTDAPEAVVSGGADNAADGYYSSISGGDANTSDGAYSSILGGYDGSVTANTCSSIPANANTSSDC